MAAPRSASVRSAYAPGTYSTDPYGRRWLVRRPLAEHRLTRPPAWCIDSGQLDEALEKGAVGVILNVRDTGERLFAPIQFFTAYGRDINHRGFGPQVRLPLEDWRPFSGQWPVLPARPDVVTQPVKKAEPARQRAFPWHEADERPAIKRNGWQQPWSEPFE